MTENEWLDHPSFKGMDSKKKEILTLLIQNTKGKSLTQALPLIMATRQELSKHNLSFDDHEQDLIFEALSQDLSPKEKTQVMKIRELSMKNRH